MMVPERQRSMLRPVPLFIGSGLVFFVLYNFLPDRAWILMARQFSRPLRKEMGEKITDEFLDLLLGGMDVMFYFSKPYRRNIENFEARYLFELKGGAKTGVLFKGGNMKVLSEGISPFDARVVFEDFPSLGRYLFAEDQDLLGWLLENKIQIDGNLNLLLKFCFMVKELKRLLGLEP